MGECLYGSTNLQFPEFSGSSGFLILREHAKLARKVRQKDDIYLVRENLILSAALPPTYIHITRGGEENIVSRKKRERGTGVRPPLNPPLHITI